MWESDYSAPVLTVTHTTQLCNASLVLVDVDLQLIHSSVFTVAAGAPPHFNVITHSMIQKRSQN